MTTDPQTMTCAWSTCSTPGIVVINGEAWCVDHIDAGFHAALHPLHSAIAALTPQEAPRCD
jgi:hypothetical protein